MSDTDPTSGAHPDPDEAEVEDTEDDDFGRDPRRWDGERRGRILANVGFVVASLSLDGDPIQRVCDRIVAAKSEYDPGNMINERDYYWFVLHTAANFRNLHHAAEHAEQIRRHPIKSIAKTRWLPWAVGAISVGLCVAGAAGYALSQSSK